MRSLALALACAIAVPVAAGVRRSAAEVQAFKRHHPCPSTGQRRGSCPGYQVDHIVPLCAAGPDEQSNMQWLSVEAHRIKTRTDVRECRRLKAKPRTPVLP
ncbi:MAG: HNH endonuclease [Ramlibacter sp.]|nr:HNH endonuclease [Ramlibacter sp.]